MVKMISRTNRSKNEVFHAILRNFSDGPEPVLKVFEEEMRRLYPSEPGLCEGSSTLREIVASNMEETESRYLLLLTEHHPSVDLLPLLLKNYRRPIQIVYGSSFPGDQSYSEACRNIRSIKTCMETGKTVVLLNMKEVHESLYDALNQHFATIRGKRYVDIGLGGHRVKCCVSSEFRLLVIERREVAYSKYPIPLLNRLEKHALNASRFIHVDEKEAQEALLQWMESLVTEDFVKSDVFIGYHVDTASSAVLFNAGNTDSQKKCLLQSVPLDAILRLSDDQDKKQVKTFYNEQEHESLFLLLRRIVSEKTKENKPKQCVYEVVSYSNILLDKDRDKLACELSLPANSLMLLNLEQFHTQREYEERLDIFLNRCTRKETENDVAILLVQCSTVHSQENLIECAKHCWVEKVKQREGELCAHAVVMFLYSIDRFVGMNQEMRKNFLLRSQYGMNFIYVDEFRPRDSFALKSLLVGRISVLFEQDETSENFTRQIVKDCIYEVIGTLIGKQEEQEKYFQRMNQMRNTLTQEHILQSMSKKTCEVLKQKECLSNYNWAENEAINKENLQEGGTFRRTLMLSLKQHVSRIVTYLISMAYKTQNLGGTIEVPHSWKTKMWLSMFEQHPVHWEDIQNYRQDNSIIENEINVSITPSIPFSFQVINIIQNLWEKYRELSSFFAAYENEYIFPILQQAIVEAGMHTVEQDFTLDLVHAILQPDSDDAIIQEAVSVTNAEHVSNRCEMKTVPNLFLTVMRNREVLCKLCEIINVCPDIKSNAQGWFEQQRNSTTFILHILACIDLLMYMQKSAKKINDSCSYMLWIESFAKVKPLFYSILDICIDQESKRRELCQLWTPLFAFDHMLWQLLPNDTDIEMKYAEILGNILKRIVPGDTSHTLDQLSYVKVVCNVLRVCYEQIRLHMLLSFRGSIKCKKCNKNIKEPVRTECEDIMCKACWDRGESGKCPVCFKEIGSTATLLSLSKADEMRLHSFKFDATSCFLEYLQNILKPELQTTVPFESITKVVLSLILDTKEEKKHVLESAAINSDINTKSNILRILLQSNNASVEESVNAYLSKMAGEELKEFATVIIHCLEQEVILCYPSSGAFDKMKQWNDLLQKCSEKMRSLSQNSTWNMEMLKTMSEMRCALRQFTLAIFKDNEASQDSQAMIDFEDTVQKICMTANAKFIKQFLLKAGYDYFGNQWCNFMKTNLKVTLCFYKITGCNENIRMNDCLFDIDVNLKHIPSRNWHQTN